MPTKNECNQYLCKSQIYDSKELLKSLVAMKKKLRDEGIADFEADERYKQIVHCKSNVDGDIFNKKQCDDYGYSQFNDYGYWDDYGPSEKGPPPKTRPKCPNGTRRNRWTLLCEKTSKSPKSPKSPKPSFFANRDTLKKRCPKGSQRTKANGRCETPTQKWQSAKARKTEENARAFEARERATEAKERATEAKERATEAKAKPTEAKAKSKSKTSETKKSRCPNGTHRCKKTGKCVMRKWDA